MGSRRGPYFNRLPPLPPNSPPGMGKQGPRARALRFWVQVSPSPLCPRGLRFSACLCCGPARPGGIGLPIKDILDDFRHSRGELKVEFRERSSVVALREPGPDEQQEHGGSQHPSDAHGRRAPAAGESTQEPTATKDREWGPCSARGSSGVARSRPYGKINECTGSKDGGRSSPRSSAASSTPWTRLAAEMEPSSASFWLRLGTQLEAQQAPPTQTARPNQSGRLLEPH